MPTNLSNASQNVTPRGIHQKPPKQSLPIVMVSFAYRKLSFVGLIKTEIKSTNKSLIFPMLVFLANH